MNTTTSRPAVTGKLTLASRLDSLEQMIGQTPLLRICYRLDGNPAEVYAKYESENMTGSIKDRMALYTLRIGYHTGRLHPGGIIVEASSGNTGISFAALGSALGHPVRIYMPNWMSQERVNLMAGFGAEVIPVSREQGGFVGAVQLARHYASEHEGVFQPLQFSNPDNIQAHRQVTGPEIARQLQMFGCCPHAFVAGVGTGGSVMGVGSYLRQHWPDVQVHPLEPANSPTLRTGNKVGSHRIQGISDEFIPAIVDLNELDDIVDVWDGDAILMAQKLCQTLGLAVGISSGANLLGAIQLKQQLGPAANVVTLLPDSNKKYLSTDLCRKEPCRDEYLSPRIDFEGFEAKR